MVVLACAFKQIDNRAALLRSISNARRPSRQLEWISRYGSDLSYSLCIDGTTYEGTEDHKGSEERGPHSEHPLLYGISSKNLLSLAMAGKSPQRLVEIVSRTKATTFTTRRLRSCFTRVSNRSLEAQH